jgi:hypothetical protein
MICDHSLIVDLCDETIDSSGIWLPLVAIVAPGNGVLGDSSNHEEIANIPQVHTLAEGSYFSWFSRSVDET